MGISSKGNIAIIPARGRSKRIPRKNIKSFFGKPIIAYSIEVALNSGLFDEVMVSTDDEEIAKIAKEFGAKVPFFRSEKNSNDFAGTVDVIDEVISWYDGNDISFKRGCCIYPTAPLLDVETLKKSFDILKEYDYDTVFPVVQYAYPIQRALKLDGAKMSLFFDEYKNSRSQDLEKSYHDAGQFYTFSVEAFLESKELWTSNTGTIVLDEMLVQDVDTPKDWKLAEHKYEIKHKS